MQTALQDYRLYAANCSKGISSFAIKSMVIDIIIKNGLKGKLLDYGAGTGELLRILKELNIFEELQGVDIIEPSADLPAGVKWYVQDLNESLQIRSYTPNLIICSEVIEHLENPRATFREIGKILTCKGYLLLTVPNQESIRSYLGLLFGGHFTSFLNKSYPAHITALLRMDLKRICEEAGFESPTFYYSNKGGIPKYPSFTWQKASFNVLKGRLFSDNVAMLAQKK